MADTKVNFTTMALTLLLRCFRSVVVLSLHPNAQAVTHATRFNITVVGNWSKRAEAAASTVITVLPHTTNCTVQVHLTATNVDLWWPNGEGTQTLHNLNTTVFILPSASASAGKSTEEYIQMKLDTRVVSVFQIYFKSLQTF